MRNFEGAAAFLVELDRILQGVDLPDIEGTAMPYGGTTG
jgi:hypothetical protein